MASKKEKTFLRQLDDILTPAPRFDPEDAAQLSTLRRLKRYQIKTAYRNNQGQDLEVKNTENPMDELLPDKNTKKEDLQRAFVAKEENRIGVERLGN